MFCVLFHKLQVLDRNLPKFKEKMKNVTKNTPSKGTADRWKKKTG